MHCSLWTSSTRVCKESLSHTVERGSCYGWRVSIYQEGQELQLQYAVAVLIAILMTGISLSREACSTLVLIWIPSVKPYRFGFVNSLSSAWLIIININRAYLALLRIRMIYHLYYSKISRNEAEQRMMQKNLCPKPLHQLYSEGKLDTQHSKTLASGRSMKMWKLLTFRNILWGFIFIFLLETELLTSRPARSRLVISELLSLFADYNTVILCSSLITGIK